VEKQVADDKSKLKKPRIRKTAPTLREQAEAARAKAEKEKPQRARKAAGVAAKPFKKIKIPRNPVTRFLARAVRAIAKVLKWLVPKYFVNSWREVRQVTWPNRKETWRLTTAVFIFATVFGALVAGVDKVLDSVFKHVILK
jgi:preprotein translocase SecE subunit